MCEGLHWHLNQMLHFLEVMWVMAKPWVKKTSEFCYNAIDIGSDALLV